MILAIAPRDLISQADLSNSDRNTLNIAGEFGDILKTAATAGFQQARSAVKQATKSLLQLLL